MPEERRMRVFEACCQGEDGFFCAEIAETEHGAVAGEEWEGGVVELGLEGWDEGCGGVGGVGG